MNVRVCLKWSNLIFIGVRFRRPVESDTTSFIWKLVLILYSNIWVYDNYLIFRLILVDLENNGIVVTWLLDSHLTYELTRGSDDVDFLQVMLSQLLFGQCVDLTWTRHVVVSESLSSRIGVVVSLVFESSSRNLVERRRQETSSRDVVNRCRQET